MKLNHFHLKIPVHRVNFYSINESALAFSDLHYMFELEIQMYMPGKNLMHNPMVIPICCDNLMSHGFGSFL